MDFASLDAELAATSEKAKVDLDKTYNEIIFLETLTSLREEPASSSGGETKGPRLKEVLDASDKEHLEDVGQLDLSGRELTTFSSQEFESWEMSRLSTLILSKNRLEALTSILPLYTLTSLDLSRNQIRSLTHIDHLPNLKILVLDYNPIDYLVPLEQCPGLKTLSLRSTLLTDPFAVAKSLKQLPKLRQLSVAQNPFRLTHQLYREHLIVQLSGLKTLDGDLLNETEREIALAVLRAAEAESQTLGAPRFSALPDESTASFAKKLKNLAENHRPENVSSPHCLVCNDLRRENENLREQLRQAKKEAALRSLQTQQLEEQLKNAKSLSDDFLNQSQVIEAIDDQISSNLRASALLAGTPRPLSSRSSLSILEPSPQKSEIFRPKSGVSIIEGLPSEDLGDEELEAFIRGSLLKVEEARSLVKALSDPQTQAPPQRSEPKSAESSSKGAPPKRLFLFKKKMEAAKKN